MATATKTGKRAPTNRRLSDAQREHLVLTHLPLVKYVLIRVSANLPPQVDREDLLEAGIIGLLDAAKRYDPDRQVQFRTFAVPRIRGGILDALRREDWLPRSMRDEVSRLSAARAALEQEHCRPPTQEELLGRLGIQKKKMDRVARVSATSTMRSLHDMVPDSADGEPDVLHATMDAANHPVERAILAEDKERLALALTKLPENERTVISLYYFEQLQLRQIAEILRVTSSRVCQIHRAALVKLQRIMEPASARHMVAC